MFRPALLLALLLPLAFRAQGASRGGVAYEYRDHNGAVVRAASLKEIPKDRLQTLVASGPEGSVGFPWPKLPRGAPAPALLLAAALLLWRRFDGFMLRLVVGTSVFLILYFQAYHRLVIEPSKDHLIRFSEELRARRGP